jgi:hypothetical protein
MKRLATAALILAAAGALLASDAAAQARGVLGIGLGVPVGDFADETGAGAQAGGGTALAGLEWLPAGQRFGIRVDGAYNRFCTTACDQVGGDLDVRYRFLNANLNGLVEFPFGANTDIRPYAIAGVGLYNYKLEGNDVVGDPGDVTDFGVNGGLGLMYSFGRIGAYVEGRFHNVFADGSDLQYIPIMLGAKINLQ